ncbi:hypothetical protein IMSAGC012_02941 [Lachnospiraceae bacterium]|nr:hypothetical protein IMSAGC012_02941 [Lachnospiraceae bacterium]
MGKDQEVLKEGSPNKAKLKMTFAVLCLAALFIVELYLMMNDSKNYLLLGIAGLAILCFVYMVTDLCFKIRGEKDILAEKRYENIYKAEKVSYIHMKQSVMDLEKLLEQIKSNSEIPTDELIEAQKAIGKVTIQRNKDNAAAVMDSNEQLRKTVASLEESLNRMTERLETPQQSLEPSVSGQEFLETTEQSRALVKEEISALADQMEMQIRQISDAVAQISAAAPSAPESIDRETIKTILDELKSEDRLPEPALPQTEAEKQKTAEPKVSEAFEIPEPVAPAAAETPVLQEAEMLEEPEFAGEEILDEQNAEITEPAAASIEPEPKAAELLKEAEPKEPEAPEDPDPVTVQESIAAEPEKPSEAVLPEIEMPQTQSMPDIDQILKAVSTEQNPVTEEMQKAQAPSSKSAGEESTGTVEELAAAGRSISPQEAAALLKEEEAEEPLKPDPAEKAKPAASSDPGHVMTPEEIAALLANM